MVVIPPIFKDNVQVTLHFVKCILGYREWRCLEHLCEYSRLSNFVWKTFRHDLQILYGRDVLEHPGNPTTKISFLGQDATHSWISWMYVAIIQEACTGGVNFPVWFPSVCAKDYYCQHDFVFLNLIAGFLW